MQYLQANFEERLEILAKARIETRQIVSEQKWCRLVIADYKHPSQQEKTLKYEILERTTRTPGSDLDGVDILALVSKKEWTEPGVVVVFQFRPPANRICVEFPAGLIDGNEAPEVSAARELKEETGLSGVAQDCSPLLFLDAGIASDSGKIITVHVDMDAPENQNLETDFDESEFIASAVIPLSKLSAQLKEFSERGFGIDGKLGGFALGIEYMRKLTPTTQ
eukprot:TRINITY_DN4163_c0_g2_i2.p1 TRINITY_DN4163_c0_g2~~TRINITY_DN4163_c0_g2_i2.p1  ORF type:complete len:222 (+),score=60.07 TRINITY_DN4163_c0_g2_i2:45-710(+)